ncbi:hypothetical protein C0J52_06606, partial [Blattella germanica]
IPLHFFNLDLPSVTDHCDQVRDCNSELLRNKSITVLHSVHSLIMHFSFFYVTAQSFQVFLDCKFPL